MTIDRSLRNEHRRQSEQFFNEELYALYKTLERMVFKNGDTPIIDKEYSTFWYDAIKNELNYNQLGESHWKMLFQDKFDLFIHMMDQIRPDNPVYGQLWVDCGILKYYNGYDFVPIKAQCEKDVNLFVSAYHDFLKTDQLSKTSTEFIPEDEESHLYGYLTPEASIDRFFCNESLFHDYEQINRVAVKTSFGVPDNVASVHVNPMRLKDMTKRLIVIPMNRIIDNIGTEYTEFYGFVSGSDRGDYLYCNEENPESGHYIHLHNGIKLTTKSDKYSYILMVTYHFGHVRKDGSLLTKRTFTDHSDGIEIPAFNDQLTLYVEGFKANRESYDYDKVDNTLTIPGIHPASYELSLMHSLTKESGILYRHSDKNSELNNTVRSGSNRVEDGVSCIYVRETYKKPVVFVNGELLHDHFGEFTYNREDKKILLCDDYSGMTYCVMETESSDNHKHIDLSRIQGSVGVIPDDKYIPITSNNIDHAIVFIEGILIKKEDVQLDERGILIPNVTPGQHYVIFNDPTGNNLVSESELNNFAIAIGHKADDSVVYINDKIVCNKEAIQLTHVPNHVGIHQEVVCVKTYERSSSTERINYFIYDRSSSQNGNWNTLDDTNNITIDIDRITSAYHHGLRHYIFNHRFSSKREEIDIYSFNFAGTIEHGLISGTVESIPGESFVPFKRIHQYGNLDHVSVFVDGVKLYNQGLSSGTGVELTIPLTKVVYNRKLKRSSNQIEFTLHEQCILDKRLLTSVVLDGESLNESEYRCKENQIITTRRGDDLRISGEVYVQYTVDYIIERKEKQEESSCAIEQLTYLDKSPSANNVFITKMPIAPGNISVWVSGQRIPKHNYQLLDDNKVFFSFDIAGGKDDHEEYTLFCDGKPVQCKRYNNDDLFIEVRQDYSLNETTIPIEYDGQMIFTAKNNNIPLALFETTDYVPIYINGLYYNGGYYLDKVNERLILTNSSCANLLKKGGYITFDWR